MNNPLKLGEFQNRGEARIMQAVGTPEFSIIRLQHYTMLVHLITQVLDNPKWEHILLPPPAQEMERFAIWFTVVAENEELWDEEVYLDPL